jgi:hypothetical protein
MIYRPRKQRSSDDHLAILRLSSNALNKRALEVFLHGHLWIVEEELRTCIGRPLWFDSALSFLVAEVVRDFARHKAPRKCSAHWIRARARRASQALERTLEVHHHAENGFVKFAGCESFQAVVGSVLERQRSLYWEELRYPVAGSSRREPLEGAD